MCIGSLKGPPVRKRNASRNYSTFIIRNLHGKITMTSWKGKYSIPFDFKKKTKIKLYIPSCPYTCLERYPLLWKQKTTGVEDLGTECKGQGGLWCRLKFSCSICIILISVFTQYFCVNGKRYLWLEFMQNLTNNFP